MTTPTKPQAISELRACGVTEEVRKLKITLTKITAAYEQHNGTTPLVLEARAILDLHNRAAEAQPTELDPKTIKKCMEIIEPLAGSSDKARHDYDGGAGSLDYETAVELCRLFREAERRIAERMAAQQLGEAW